VEEALEHAHVSLTPGQAFGPSAARYVRISLGMQDDQLQLALERLKDWYSAR
jgi:aspartate/methionine/tyrosine aminotransferase